MARNRKRNDDAPQPPAHSGPGLGGLIGCVLALAAIVYALIYAACRTEGFRAYAQDHLERQLGMPVRIERSFATPKLDVVLVGVRSEESGQKGKAGFRAGEIALDWSVARALSRGGRMMQELRIRDLSLAMVPAESGGWAPLAFERIGSWVSEWGGITVPEPKAEKPAGADTAKDGKTGGAATPPPASLSWDRLRLTIDGGQITWSGRRGEELAGVSGIHLDVTPVQLPNRAMTHFHLTFDEAHVGRERSLKGFTFEAIRTGGRSIILGCSGEWKAARKP